MACMLNTLEQVTSINSMVEWVCVCVCLCVMVGEGQFNLETNTVLLLLLRPMTPTLTHLSGENDEI